MSHPAINRPSDKPRPVIALAGNPNAGKTCIFNALTGGHQTVGNWPGVTVEKKTGRYQYQDQTYEVVDLPGTYSLQPYTEDEAVTRDFILTARPAVIVNVVDASHLQRNLYLTVQLLELGVKCIVALNMSDVKDRDFDVDAATLSLLLGAPVIPTVGTAGRGIDRLKSVIAQVADKPRPADGLRIYYGAEVEPHLAELTRLLACARPQAPYPPRWQALNLLEAAGDDDPADDDVKRLTVKIKKHIRGVTGQDPPVVISAHRHGFVAGLLREAATPGTTPTPGATLSDRIDRVLTHPAVGIPLFLAAVFLTFEVAFRIGDPLTRLVEAGAGALGRWLLPLLPSPIFASLAEKGVGGGLVSVFVFVPNIFILFLAFAFMEDSGYMARVAYVADGLMHRIGLHGRSFIPMVLGLGCNVPAVLATRTLDNRRDRLITILTIPFMSCSARLPVYVLFTGAFFPRYRGIIIWGLYALGICVAAASAKLAGAVLYRGESTHFVIELPTYRLPTLRGVFIHAAERTLEFVKRAGLIIVAASVVLWGLANLPAGVTYAGPDSVLASAGRVVAPILGPAGFGTWEAAVSLMAGFVAKELVVGSLGVVYGIGLDGLGTAVAQRFTPLSAAAFLVMTLIYIPCVATVAAIKKESRSWRLTLLVVIYTLAIGWAAAVGVYQMGRLLGLE